MIKAPKSACKSVVLPAFPYGLVRFKRYYRNS